jgi:hypothetical protein
MDNKRYDNKKCLRMKAEISLMQKLLSLILFSTLIGIIFDNSAIAQNPCDEMGPGCRVLNAAEVKAFKELVLAVKDLLPVPDATRYMSDGAIEASTMPFVALTKIPGAVYTGLSWQTGCFPESPYNTLLFGYDARASQEKPAGKEKDPLAAIQAMGAAIESKIELSAELWPYPFLVYVEDGKAMDVPDPEAYNIEKSDQFLTWQTGDDIVSLNMIFGTRTVKEAETERIDKPSSEFAPVKSIELIITGPKNEVATLKKRIDRNAFAGLLGPVVK